MTFEQIIAVLILFIFTVISGYYIKVNWEDFGKELLIKLITLFTITGSLSWAIVVVLSWINGVNVDYSF
jgi:hypothetical protein